jgi:ketosteroid isomerase-like protein
MMPAVDREQLAGWVAAYEEAWRTPGTDRLSDLFTPDATYLTEPYADPIRGLPAIASFWEEGRDGPDEVFTMRSEVVAVDGDVGVVRVEVRYGEPVDQEYRDLWIVRTDASGRCDAFEEWPIWPGHGRSPGTATA